jgi:hypothetical protein
LICSFRRDSHGRGVIRIVIRHFIISWIGRDEIVLLFLMRLSLMIIVWTLFDLEVAAPILGKSGSFTPSIDGMAPFVLT